MERHTSNRHSFYLIFRKDDLHRLYMVFLVNLLDQLCASNRAVGFVLINQVIREVVSDIESDFAIRRSRHFAFVDH